MTGFDIISAKRAVAFEKRIAGAIADPGVIDVSASWTASLPKPLLELLKAGRKAEFDGYMAKALGPATKADLRVFNWLDEILA